MKKLLGFKIRMFTSIAFLLIIISITNSCKKESENVPGNNEVIIQGMAFNPVNITITSGTTVIWSNKDGTDHTVTSNTGLFDSGSISNNGTYSHTFSSIGTFPYHCTIHTTMTGSVIVN
jgi:plastocyanin